MSFLITRVSRARVTARPRMRHEEAYIHVRASARGDAIQIFHEDGTIQSSRLALASVNSEHFYSLRSLPHAVVKARRSARIYVHCKKSKKSNISRARGWRRHVQVPVTARACVRTWRRMLIAKRPGTRGRIAPPIVREEFFVRECESFASL